MAHRIDTVEGRNRLKPRTPPYWHKLATGCHIGFRRISSGSEGTWLAQAYDPSSSKQTRQSLGGLSGYPAHQRFNEAKKKAEAWFEHLERGGSIKAITVEEACANYVKRLKESGAAKNSADLEARFKRWVNDDKIATVNLQKLTRKAVDEWRNRLANAPVLTNPHTDKTKTRTRSPAALNRDMAALRAALNNAHDHGDVTSNMAWRVALRAVENADGRRDTYLDLQQRATIISKAPVDLAALLRGLSLVPLRPGALASLTVASLNIQLGVLTVGKDKAGRDRKIKLPLETAKFFKLQAEKKLPAAALLTRTDGKAWDKDSWKKPIKTAALAAELSESVTAYTLRHSVITDLVTNGLDLLTVAQLSGTSVAMIEKHYGHHRSDLAEKALAALAI
ncbi:MAG: tyrosine-type recombinase/integrase [Gammaproteobacteria bacterium]|nr:tyrosine-type recombinase/integrase [Gammaproteobacteria bacterium]MBU0786539.1 tyrosine-type recombinase/integrase [Gammaproteobacteria bacterium]MBU0817147.1 tyrosine-type recombinase/integrase [Gammaproteobacteria bacterium]MBU1787732.1 tyrosine-type recombinase/integrase [Gammaproteobacteria bacterium]